MEWGQEQAGLPIDGFSDKMLLLAFELDRLLDDPHRDFQERRRRIDQLVLMHGTVAIFSKLLEDVTHASLGTNDCVPWNPQALGDGISRLKANAMDIESQLIGILLHSDNGVVAIGLVNTHCAGRPHPMGVQEDHDLPDHLLRLPRLDHPLFAFGTNAVEVGQPFRGLLNDVKHLLPKGLDQLFGKVWANAFDHPRAEILFDTFQRAGWDHTQRLGLELQAMRPICHPAALTLNVLARSDRRCCADDGDEVAMTTDFHPEDAETRLLTMERHTLNGTSQVFHGTRIG